MVMYLVSYRSGGVWSVVRFFDRAAAMSFAYQFREYRICPVIG